jgi:opacity protein-like surface antigen
MKIRSLAIAAALACVSAAHAADMPTKASPLTGIPLAGCGTYFGLNTMGMAGAMNNTGVPGASVVQGEIGGQIGYTCTNANGNFWFVEGMFDFANINGQSQGLSLSGPVDLFQRAGIGTPIASMLSLFPTLGTLSTPTLPILPAGVTAGPGVAYLYAGVHEQDVSAQLNAATNRVWSISPEVGVGIRYRLSNAVVADTFVGTQFRGQGVCIGGVCSGTGNAVRVGFSLNY